MPYARRDVFLDEITDPYEIRKQIGRLADVARKKGRLLEFAILGALGVVAVFAKGYLAGRR